MSDDIQREALARVIAARLLRCNYDELAVVEEALVRIDTSASKRFNILFRTFGRLTVVAPVANGSFGHVQWRCRCSCGATTIAAGNNLRSGRMSSCGCLRREMSAVANLRHGHSRPGQVSTTYRTWRSMRTRCLDANDFSYTSYGGRGITICERWTAFENFLADMGERPPGTTLDRVDNDGNYEPANCRWATVAQQNRNKRTTKLEPHEPAQIRWLASTGGRHRDIAKHFNISPSFVGLIVKGKAYK